MVFDQWNSLCYILESRERIFSLIFFYLNTEAKLLQGKCNSIACQSLTVHQTIILSQESDK